MESHVKILGWLNIGFGILGLLTTVAILGGSMAVSSILGVGGDEAMVPMHIVALIGGAFAIFTLLLSMPSLIVGYGLLYHRSWARICGIVLAVLSLFHVPVGTLLGIYMLWVLLKPETEELFRNA